MIDRGTVTHLGAAVSAFGILAAIGLLIIIIAGALMGRAGGTEDSK